MHILVTGGCGFIGSHVVEYHLTQGDQVHAVDDLSTGTLDNILSFQGNPNFRFEQADVLTWQNLEKTVTWSDRVYHLAAVVGVYRVLAEPIKVLATNIPGCERILRAIASSAWKPPMLIASSSEVYGQCVHTAFKEEDDLVLEGMAQNRWNYAVSKIADEAFGLSYARKLNLPILVLRFFNTIGPRQTGRYGMVVPRLISQAVRGEPLTVYGDGTQTRSFCDVRDTVCALDALASSPRSSGEIINVGNDREISINALAHLILERSESRSEITYIPYEEAYGEPYVDIQRRRPNLEKFFRLSQFNHHWKLEDTLDDLIHWERQKLTFSAGSREKNKV